MRVLDLLSFAVTTFMVGMYFGRVVRPCRPVPVDTLRGITLLVASHGLRAAARLADLPPDTVRLAFWVELAAWPVAVWLIWRGQTAPSSSVKLAP